MEIDLKALRKCALYVDEFMFLALINEGENPLTDGYHWASGMMERMEQGMWVKYCEDTIELRSKAKELFENPKQADTVTDIIEYLNKKTGRKYSAKTQANRKFVSGRLKEGYTEADLQKVIDTMCSKWLHDSKMNMYLRPETLFNPTKFQTYINMVKREDKDWTVKQV
jgi:uncharacterized phage protein (TIGR02220 family)